MAPAYPQRGRLYYALVDKPRPVLVVSPNGRNEFATDVLVVPCSTQITIAPTHVHLRKGEGGISARSILKCEQVTNVSKRMLRTSTLGPPLSPTRMAEVERCLQHAIGIDVGGE